MSQPWNQLWHCILIAPNGLPQEYKIRAPSEGILFDRIALWKPDWTVARDEYGVPLVRREATT